MAAWNQKRRDPLTLEERRKNAIQQLLLMKKHSEGADSSTSSTLSEADVARKFGVTRGCVSQWVKDYRKAGNSLEGLNSRKHTGRPPQMTEEQKAKLVSMILRGALYYGFETDLWTTERIRKLIRVHFEIKYNRNHVAKILHSLNLSWQKPKKEARERDEGEVRNWVQNVLPQ
ncbi:MAG: winged helix-turn-helix domain-containing protein, partial [archaeon]|nr:winged helix-turn-helix domain-containing protein [archaeon]